MKPNTEEDFWRGVHKTRECWLWTRSVTTRGYPQFRIRGSKIDGHRYAWIVTRGEIPQGMIVCHKCDNPRCVRPSHLFLGTHRDNTMDAIRKGRRTNGPVVRNRARGTRHGRYKHGRYAIA